MSLYNLKKGKLGGLHPSKIISVVITMIKNNNVNNQPIVYYLVMATVVVFVFCEFIGRGPFQPVAEALETIKLKYLVMFLSIFLLLVIVIGKKKSFFRNGVFLSESKLFLSSIFSLAIITFYYQVRNGFRLFTILEFGYLILPLVFVILIVSVDYKNITRVLDNCFYVVLIAFLLCNIDILNPSSLLDISFSDSMSSPFESGSAIVFVCFELYFLIRYGRRNIKSFICLLLTILSFKRVCIIKAIMFFVFFPLIKNKKIPRWIFVLVIVFFCALPLLLELIYSNDFARIVLAKYGIEMNELTMDRFARTVYVLEHMSQIKYGYGSITNFLTNTYGIHKYDSRSLHCDILQIYLECSFIGTFAYTITNFLAVKKNMISFLLMLHIFTEMIVNHPIGSGCVGNWIMIYLIIVYCNYKEDVTFYKEGKNKRKRFKLGKIVI